MRRVWFYGPEWVFFGWRDLWLDLIPLRLGGDEYGRRTVALGWHVTGRAVVAISRPGRLYPPDGWEWVDPNTGALVKASIYPYGGGVRQHGVQLSVQRADYPVPVIVVRIPQTAVRELGELIGASRRLVWHDPRNADDEFWNPQEGR